MEITLELHKHGGTKADGHYLVFSDNVKDFTKLMSIAESKYKSTTDSDMEISLHFFRNDHLIKMSDDDDYRNFLRIYKDNKKGGVVQVHVENAREKELRGVYSKLNPEPLDKLFEQQFDELDVGAVGKHEINGKVKGKFLIAYYCAEKDKIKSGVRKDVELYKEIAQSLGFSEDNIDERKNPNREDLLEYFDTYRDGDHREEECFIFAFSGHGNIEEKYRYPDGSIKTKWVGEYIFLRDGSVRVQELVGKLKQCKLPTIGPTIMLLNACRGSFSERSNKKKDIHLCSEETTTTNMKNIILAYATIPNKHSFTGKSGSVFTYFLHRKITENQGRVSPIEFHQLLTEVNELVAKNNIYVEKIPSVEGGQNKKDVVRDKCLASEAVFQKNCTLNKNK